MPESSITCPKCGQSFEPTAAMAAEVESRIRRELEARAAERDQAATAREKAAEAKAAAAERRAAQLDQEVTSRLADERRRLTEELRKQARTEAEADAAAQLKAAREDAELLRTRLAASEQAELEYRRKAQQLEDDRRRMELDKQRAIDEALKEQRELAQREEAEKSRLKLEDKDNLINQLRRQIEELNRRAEQGSQQLQGETLELNLEATLRLAFPHDTIEPVPKGTFGGDTVHRVVGPLGATAGTILWECKRTKAFSDGWLAKLRTDQREAKADVAILVTATMPKDVRHFQQIDRVWVCSEACAIPLAAAIREGLVGVAAAKKASEGIQGKAEMLYEHVHSPVFRQRVQALVEAFETLRDDLAAERKAMERQWAKREKHLSLAILNTSAMFGEMQGIVGRSLPEIKALELPGVEPRRDGTHDLLPQ